MENFSSRSKYAEYIQEPDLLFSRFLKESEDMKDIDYREEMKNWLGHIQKIKPKAALVDTRFFEFTIRPDTQLWVANEIMPGVIQAGLRRLAFLTTPHLFSRVSIDQTVDELNPESGDFQSAHFDDEEAAREWLRE